MENLTAISPIDGRYFNKVSRLSEICSEYALIKYRIIVELSWFKTLADETKFEPLSPFTTKQIESLDNMIKDFNYQDAKTVKLFEAQTNHDVKAVEYFIKQKLSALFNKEIEFIHFGCTSEDINNIAYALMLRDLRQVLVEEITAVTSKCQQIATQNASLPMLARTHGQPATPTTLGKEFANVVNRFKTQLNQLEKVEILAKCNGATGNFNPHVVACPNIDWHKLSEKFIQNLGLKNIALTTQIEPHDYIAQYLHTLIRLNTIAIDLSRDIWSYISLEYFIQINKSSEVGSSTMPHKVNPIDFENAEGNLGVANSLCSHLAEKLPISRMQRDLSDSTVLRNIGNVGGYTLLGFKSLLKGLFKLEVAEQNLLKDLDNHWEILAEPVQTVMRYYKLPNPYEKLKDFTRGKKITRDQLHEFINSLEIPQDAKQNLLKLTPSTYIGIAEKLAKL